MRILLGIAPFVFDNTYPGDMNRPLRKKGFTLIQGPTPCLGMLYIASVLRRDSHHDVSYFEGAFHGVPELLATIERWRPDVVGFMVTVPFWKNTQRTIRAVRDRFPEVRILVGGRHVDLVREEIMRDCAEIDFAGVGDCEYTVKELLDTLEKGGDPASVPGLLIRSGGEIMATAPREPIQDLDEIPFPAFDLVEFNRYAPSIGQYNRLPNITMIGSRGCPHRCLFCTSEDDLRERSVENIIAEIDWLVRDFGLKDILFYDEDLTEKHDRLEHLCDTLIARDYDLTWSGNARSDNIAGMDEKLLRKMRRAGCWKLLFGLESGVQRDLDTLRKEFTVEESVVAVEKASRAGISLFCTFIFGIPDQTYDDCLKTIDFACGLKGIEFAKFLTFTPFPGSEVYNDIDRYGKIVAPPSKMTVNNITFVPHTLTVEQITELYRIGMKSFYKRPSYILHRLVTMRSIDHLKQNIRGFRAFLLSR
ncbi:B12-binding domain-containing radical SAM protein [Thermodesulfobacteriota bacterium]